MNSPTSSVVACRTPYHSLGVSNRAMVNINAIDCCKETPHELLDGTADRSTHLKIVVVAFLCSTAFLLTTN
jgi:hypothetical protein